MSRQINASRREFLRMASAMSVVGAGAPLALNLLAMSTAAAQSANSYKAIVCLYLGGGNDHANTVLATDPGSWSKYTTYRAPIALAPVGAPSGVLPIVPLTAQPGREFALHPQLGALQSLFSQKRLAIVANVGTLAEPTSLAQYKAKSASLPVNLFSHNDQAAIWQSGQPEGASIGWGGQMGDLLASMNANTLFTSVSTSGNALFLAGNSTHQFQMGSSGIPSITDLSSGNHLWSAPAGKNPLGQVVAAANNGGNALEQAYAATVNSSIAAQGLLSTALPAPSAFPIPYYIDPSVSDNLTAGNPLAVQLQTVARYIAARSSLGVNRQVFYVNLGGFDTHDSQAASHTDLMARLAHGLAYFDATLGTLGMRDQVTLFTASDFGRAFVSNAGGTDHGWGSHHFVLGGAVKGGDIFGTFPATDINHSQDIGNGALLPQYSVDQYAASLGSWFGLSKSQNAQIFPNLAKFNGTLGFI